MRLAAAVFLALATAPYMAAAEPVRGEFCAGAAPCREMTCGQTIEPEPEARTYTFARSAAARYDIGILGGGTTRIPCDGKVSVELHLEVPSLPHGAVVSLTIAATSDEKASWRIRLTERELKAPIQLSGPAGAYTLRFESDRHKPLVKTIELGATTTVLNAKLEAFPALTGRVIDRSTGVPIAGVLITGEPKFGRAVSNAAGQFSLSLDPNDWPKTLTFSAGGYAELVIPAPPARTNAAIGDVGVSRGGSIVVQLQEPKAGDVATLELYRMLNDGRRLGPLVRSVHLEKGADSRISKFENVEPGDYVVMAVGGEMCEKLAEPVVVTSAAESQLPLSVIPFQLRVKARSQGEALPNAHVAIRNRDMFWTAEINADDSGIAAVTLWQGGRFNATVDSSGTPYLERRVIERNEDTEWVIDIPALEVTGVVLDAATGQPIPRAGVALTMESAQGYQMSVHTDAGPDGTFRFAPVSYGEHTLKAAARGYPVRELTYTFKEPEMRHSVTVKLDSAPPIRLSVTDSHGNPIADARALQFNGLTRRGLASTDGGGTVDVLVPPGEMRDVFVVPRDGSLAFVRLAAPARDMTLTVPDGGSRLVLRAETDGGKAIPNVAVVARYNGIVIPYEVLVALMARQGRQTASDAQGQIVFDHMPAGVYEFWPVGSVAELHEVAVGAGPNAPVRIAAGPGENVAVMTFEPAAKP